MDFETMQITLTFVAVFIVASVILSLVYKFGMKEKSYEEALAEQRQSPQNLLSTKQKPKEKKSKKTSKKKDISEDNKVPEKVEMKGILKQSDQNQKKQVQIDEPDNVAEPVQKEVKIVEPTKAQPKILKKKDNEQSKAEIIKEKPEIKVELAEKESKNKKRNSVEEVKEERKISVETVAPTQLQEVQEIPDNILKKNTKVQGKPKKDVEEKIVPLTNGYVQNQPKTNKKKKNDLSSLQKLTAAPGNPSIESLREIIRQAELTHEDIQFLVELLLNKTQNSKVGSGDWSEGKSDPVQRLKKQLAEKEAAFNDLQEVLNGAQLKVKEIRSEQLSERNSLTQKIKMYEEQLQNQQIEIHSNNNRFVALTQELQNIQVQLNEEKMKNHSLIEEVNASQMQKQLIAQESAHLKAEIATRNEQLAMEINHVQKINMEKESNFIVQLNNLSQELMEKTHQLEELRVDLKNKTEILYRQEGESKSEIAQLNALMQQQAEEIRKTEQGKEELLEELNNLKKKESISNNIISQLKKEIEQLQQQKIQSEASIENNKVNETEILNLKNEMTSMKNQLEENEKKFKVELEATLHKLTKLESELSEQKTKNNDLRNKNYKIMEALNVAETRIKNGNSDEADKVALIESQKKFLIRLLPEINGVNEISTEKWEEECASLVNNYLQSLKKNEDSNENLQARIEHYKSVIKDTEGMLNKLQAHIDAEEISWKNEIKSKDSELKELKEKVERSKNLETINGSTVGQ